MDYPEIIFDDAHITVINKPAGWVVHEGAGEHAQTIMDWFVKNFPDITHETWPDPTRPGIVHRLDKDTSGVMVLAKTPEVLAELQSQFKERTTTKIYHGIVAGVPNPNEGEIVTFLGRHPKRRQEQAVLPVQRGQSARREAITEYRVIKTIGLNAKEEGNISLVEFRPKTGRMHQLRVHAKHLGTPLLGDKTYYTKPSKRISHLVGAHRQMLHAVSLEFRHPQTHHRVYFTSSLPPDMKRVVLNQ